VNIGITCYPTYGGSGIVATELGLELATRGHEVHFITYSNPIRLDPGIPRIHYHEVEVSNYPLFQYPPYCLALASRMLDVADAYDVDLLHVHYAIPHSISAMLAQQMIRADKVTQHETRPPARPAPNVARDVVVLHLTKPADVGAQLTGSMEVDVRSGLAAPDMLAAAIDVRLERFAQAEMIEMRPYPAGRAR